MAPLGTHVAPTLRTWRLWLLVLAMLGLFVFDIIVPPVIVLPLVCVPVLIAALWFSPRVVAALVVVSAVMTAISGLKNGYFGSVNGVLWMAAMLIVGLLAVAVASARVRIERQREESTLLFRAALDAEFDPHVILEAVRDRTGRIVDFVYVDANAAACAYNNTRYEDLIGMRLLDLLPGHLAAGLLQTYAHVVETGEPLILDDYAYEQELRGGESRRYDIRGVKVGESISYTWRDVTDRFEAAQQVIGSEERYRLLAENASDVVLRHRVGDIVWVSPSLTQALGWQPERWIGRSLTEFVREEDLPILNDAQARMDAGESQVVRVRVADVNGDWHWIECHSRAYLDAAGNLDGYRTSFRVVDREVETEGALRWRATYDDLTGGLKRDAALQRLRATCAHPREPGSETAVLFVDVDDFKNVNDTRGHAVGDAVLHRIATVIRECVRSGDSIARVGGDEFLVILDGLHSMSEGTAIAEKIRTRCAEPMALREGTITVTVSIGVAFSSPFETEDDLMVRADRAMYRAKAAGRNHVITIESPGAHRTQQAAGEG